MSALTREEQAQLAWITGDVVKAELLFNASENEEELEKVQEAYSDAYHALGRRIDALRDMIEWIQLHEPNHEKILDRIEEEMEDIDSLLKEFPEPYY